MEFSKEQQEVYDRLSEYAKEKGYILNQDTEMLGNIIQGLINLSEAKGEEYCPCRLVTGKPEADKKIICPCAYHEDEIAKQGHCHCHLFFAK